MIAFYYFTFAAFFYYLIYVKSNDVFHPLAIGISFWYLSAGVSNMGQFYTYSQNNLSILTNFVIFLAGLFFIFPVFFSKKINKRKLQGKKIEFSLNYKILFNLFLLLSILNFFLRFKSQLLSPVFFSVDDSLDIKSLVPPALPIMNLFDVSMSFFAILCFFEYKYSLFLSNSRKYILFGYIIFFILVTIFYKVSRGEFIAFALAVIYLNFLSKELNFNFKKFISIFIFICTFFYIGLNRISEDSLVSNHFGTGFFSVIFSQIYTYVAMNFQNLNKLIISDVEPTYFWGALKFILSPFFKYEYDNNLLGLVNFETDFFNAKTYIYYFYHDLGLVGVLIYSLTIGILIQSIYNLSLSSFKFFALVACFMKPIFFMFFGNYFFGEMITTLPFFIILFLVLLMKSNTIKY